MVAESNLHGVHNRWKHQIKLNFLIYPSFLKKRNTKSFTLRKKQNKSYKNKHENYNKPPTPDLHTTTSPIPTSNPLTDGDREGENGWAQKQNVGCCKC